MALEIVGALIVLSHLMVMGMLILWFGLRKPTSMEQFRTRFRQQFLGSGNRR
ncbi:hypothetical protein [Silvibacterium dinghuense]|uniref:hypothetical protein n=1 Tax=Silvibacterium dinghuense TaxID=1560006 RepID=UPI0013E93220|nr:hypothetical protein [Silvibacterium dinghuense]GGG96831.1 hypothetical protein GCM10011586_10050 [Silvibacterium dinghuense]